MPRDADECGEGASRRPSITGSGANRADAFSVSIALAHHLRRGGRQRREAGATAQRAIPLLSNWATRVYSPCRERRLRSGPWCLGGVDHGHKQILAVYHTCPVMIVAETAEDTIVELSLNELGGGV